MKMMSVASCGLAKKCTGGGEARTGRAQSLPLARRWLHMGSRSSLKLKPLIVIVGVVCSISARKGNIVHHRETVARQTAARA